ncbi:MAG: right-handed parallel beta-helix repeat-containing protein [Sphingobacteriales bacterium]|jgi:hypothetical protein|nr:right-handed parallel beta-helix repeat-containing protein [Sphingobacteriales bacterium]
MNYKTILFAFFCCLFSLNLSASTYYVATNGNDNSGNGSVGNPYKTLQHALEVAVDNDIIELRGGNYTSNEIRINQNNLTIRSYQGEWAIITAPTNVEDATSCIWYHEPEIVGGTLERLEIVGGYYYGIKFESNWDWDNTVPMAQRRGVSNVTIRNCKIHNTGRDCIKLAPAADNITIEGCEIYNSGIGPVNVADQNAEGIDCVNGDNLTVRNCYIHHTFSTGIYSKGGAINTLIENNLVSNCGEGGIMLGFYTDEEWFDTQINPNLYESRGGTVRNNIVINTQLEGIGMYAALDGKMYNNTIIDAAQTDHAALHISPGIIWTEAANNDVYIPCRNIMVQNNIFVQSNNITRPIASIRYMNDDINTNMQGTNIVNHNVYYRAAGVIFNDGINWEDLSLAQWTSATGFDANSQNVNPNLDANHHLNATSSCINGATTIAGLTNDYDGNPRTNTPDIGADEYGAGANLSVPPPAGILGTGATVFTSIGYMPKSNTVLKSYPNPCNQKTVLNFDISTPDNIAIQLFDLKGSLVAVIYNGTLTAATYQFEVNLTHLPTGIYTLQLQGSQLYGIQKIMVIK